MPRVLNVSGVTTLSGFQQLQQRNCGAGTTALRYTKARYRVVDELSCWQQDFVDQVHLDLGSKAKAKTAEESDNQYMLREPSSAYAINFRSEMRSLRTKNTVNKNENSVRSNC
ncbi:MAG: hypothetical protein ACJAUP_000850 [Cellvibrionaceae bacterium]|jgi:hypothetical protein